MVALLLLFALTPPVGAVLYLGFGARKLRQKTERKPKPAERSAGPETPRGAAAIDDLDRMVQARPTGPRVRRRPWRAGA